MDKKQKKLYEWQKYVSLSHYFTFEYIHITKLLSQKYTVVNAIPNFNFESKRRNFILGYVISHSFECYSYWDNNLLF